MRWLLFVAIVVICFVVAEVPAYAKITTSEATAVQVAKKADDLLKFKSCGTDCESAYDGLDFIGVTVRDGLVVLDLSPLRTIDATGSLTSASYEEITFQKKVVEHYCGVAGWNWITSSHGAFWRWGNSKTKNYLTFTNSGGHFLAFAADNNTATYTLTISL